ncbi:uncharacterized protein V1516DRAFT_669709 [Lipomyces oligophaga]|uniref:uncharacterized protein n=1 Tax=Lipomyces oligophaga TaxID=45792 RepID=UPI0034CEC1CA
MSAQIVIIGAGLFGALLAARFRDAPAAKSNHVYITLIDARPDFVYLPLYIRNCVNDVSHYLVTPLDKIFEKRPEIGTVVCGRVVEIDQFRKQVLLEHGDPISFDYLVLATGYSFDEPIKVPLSTHSEIMSYLDSRREMIKQSRNVIILGGGPTGCELACEIAHQYGTTKKITLVHSKEKPLTNIYLEKLRRKTEQILLQENVELIFNSYGRDNNDGSVTITSNENSTAVTTMLADLVFNTFIATPATEWAPSEWKDPQSRIKVTSTLQVEGADPGIFAIGDIINTEDLKIGIKVNYAVPAVFNNLIALSTGLPATSMYSPPVSESFVLTLKPKVAVGQLALPLFGLIYLPSWFLRTLGQNVGAERAIRIIGYST